MQEKRDNGDQQETMLQFHRFAKVERCIFLFFSFLILHSGNKSVGEGKKSKEELSSAAIICRQLSLAGNKFSSFMEKRIRRFRMNRNRI